jgi:sensor histidine kinase YesM
MAAFKRAIWTLMLLHAALTAYTQDTVRLVQDRQWDSCYNMEQYAGYYIDTFNALPFSKIHLKQFHPDTNKQRQMRQAFGNRKITLWIKWKIYNPSNQPENVLLVFNRMSFLSIYLKKGNDLEFIKSNHDLFTPATKNERRGFRFIALPQQTVEVYAKMNDAFKNFAREYPIIIRPNEYEQVMKDLLQQQRYYVYTDVLFLAIILFIVIHSLAQYYFIRRKEFLLYACYAFCVFSFFLFKFEEASWNDLFFSHFPYIHKYGNNPLSYLMFYAYFRFVRTFIDFRLISGRFLSIIRTTEAILIAMIFLDLLMAAFNFHYLKSWTFNIVRIYLIIISFYGIILLFLSKSALTRFIAVGSGCFVTGALLAMVLSWILSGPYIGKFDPIIYMQLGMVLELICFTLGLSYKTSLIEKDKIKAQQELIVQLEENKKLQDELTFKLESRVKEQTAHIIEQQAQLEKEKEQQLTLEFTRKITEMELQLLKSQLNPHFYFNTLNNLYGLAMIAPKKAPDAILKLSDIMEYVIYDCRHDKVPVEKELRFINSYIELEKLRYDDSANITLEISGHSEGKQISPLLLVQFIENAFKHGLEQHKSNSYLNIKISLYQDQLIYESVNSKNDKEISVSGGVGLMNVKKRLEIIYPEKHQLEISSGAREYIVRLSIQLS